jgi:hypothetical protein
MSDKTLDRVDFQTIKDRAATKRAQCMRRYATDSLAVVGSTFRTHPVIAIAAILIFSLGVKMFYLSAPTAEADPRPVPSGSRNSVQTHADHVIKDNVLAKD